MLMSWLAQTVCGLQSEGENLVLATVLSKSGSAPCLAGAKMVVRSNGVSIGTVGGGMLEAAVQKKAGNVFKTGSSQIMTFDLSGEDAASMQMICGGKVEILIELIPVSANNTTVFEELRSAMQIGEKCYFVTFLGTVGDEMGQAEFCLVRENGTVAGEFNHPHSWLETLLEKSFRSTYPVVHVIQNRKYVIERCFVPSSAYIFGAGHVSQQLASMAEMVGFKTCVIDDRSEFASRGRFPGADEIKVLDSFEECFSGLEMDGDSYVVIVTRGHRYDKTVLEQALRTDAGCIGMMGSGKKRDELFKLLLKEGFSSDDLNRVNCPIGVDIAASTTAEIAVSIIAQLIQARAKTGE
ncbi:MAG: XdhC family aldehyde oxidoreductase maturation factor [Deltaproteobacteria bacterium]